MYNRDRRKSSLQICRPCDHIYIQSSGVLQGIVHVNEIMQGLRRKGEWRKEQRTTHDIYNLQASRPYV